MFQAPTRTTSFVAPADPIDVDQRYLFKLVKLEDEGVSKFADPAKNETFHNIRWHFRCALASNPTVPILNTDNEAWEHIEWTSSKTGKNPKNGMVAKARLWIEAFLGHAIEDEEITPDLPSLILEKVASGFFEEVEATSREGEAYTKLKILKIGPYRAGAKAEAKPAPASKPAAPAEKDLPF